MVRVKKGAWFRAKILKEIPESHFIVGTATREEINLAIKKYNSNTYNDAPWGDVRIRTDCNQIYMITITGHSLILSFNPLVNSFLTTDFKWYHVYAEDSWQALDESFAGKTLRYYN